MRHFGIILQFLTRFYIPVDFKSSAEDITKGLRYFTAVGLVIGGVLLLAAEALTYTNGGTLFQATALLGVWVIITGGLHLDGVADSADGLLSGRNRDRILEIMKDSHIGSFGVVALMGLLGLKMAALVELFNRHDLMPVFIAPILARAVVVFAAAIFTYAREEGMGNFFIGKATVSDLWINGIVALVALGVLGGVKALLLGAVTVSILWLMTQAINKTLKGITGDILGLIIEGSELLFLVLWIL